MDMHFSPFFRAVFFQPRIGCVIAKSKTFPFKTRKIQSVIPLKVYTISVLHPKLQNTNYRIGLGLEETITLSELGVLIDVFLQGGSS